MLNNLRVLCKDKATRGVSALSQIFFCSWNAWSLAFYIQIAQWWSAAGQAFVTALFIAYIVMMLYYRQKERRKDKPAPQIKKPSAIARFFNWPGSPQRYIPMSNPNRCCRKH